MNNETKKVIPELRFPEFKKSEEWIIKKLGLITNTTIGEFVIRTKQDPNSLYPVYNGGKSYTGFYDEYNNEANKIVISARGANAGFVNLVKQKYWAGNSCYSVEVLEKDQISLELIFYYIKHNQRRFTDNQQAANIPSISKGDVEKFKISYPENFQEQQKVASCLSSLDEVIFAYNDKLEGLKTYKKGLMQNLFPQVGEKTPKLRFKEFEKDGEWIFEPLNKVYSFLVTNSFSREYLNYENGKVKNIHYGDIHTKFSTLFDITKEEVPFINSEVSIDRIRQECYCKEGDIVFADASEDMNDVGKSIEIISLNNEKLLSGLHTLLARQIEPKLIVGFGGYLFQSNKIRSQIKKEAQGAKVLGVSGTRLSNIEIYYPKNKKEQQKIANTLSSLDELIKEQVYKIEQLKLHKKGLMQGLFPKVKN